MTYKTAYWDTESQSQKERDCTPEEVMEIEQRKASPANVNAPTLAAITALEATVTPRRVREAVTSPAGYAWLANVDAEIAALRVCLV